MYKIKKLQINNISKDYLDTINNVNTKKYIHFARTGKYLKNKNDLIKYLKLLPKNELIYGVFNHKKHIANFKFQLVGKKIYIGFLVFLKFQGKAIFLKIFPKVIKKFKLKYKNHNKLYLGVDSKNSRAISLYKKLGFLRVKKNKRDMYLRIKD